MKATKSVSKTQSKRRWPLRLAIGLIVFLLIFSVVSFFMIGQVFDENFGRAEPAEYNAYLTYSDVAEGYPRCEISFQSGGNRLQGYVYGEGSDKALVVISHGLGGGADSYMAEITCFVDAGYRVLAFDNTGSHASEGEGTTSLVQSVIDLDAALGYIQSDSNLADLPVLLYGHSWGGYAVTAVLNYDHPSVAASVSVAGYNDPMKFLYEQARDMIGWFAAVEYPYLWTYQRAVGGSAVGLTAVDGINKSGVPVLVIHGDADDVVLMDGAGIMAQRDRITNPNAVFVVRDTQGQNGHNNLSISKDASQYIDAANEIYSGYWEQYDGDIPDDIRRDYYDGIDRHLTSQLDEEYVELVLEFFENSLK